MLIGRESARHDQSALEAGASDELSAGLHPP